MPRWQITSTSSACFSAWRERELLHALGGRFPALAFSEVVPGPPPPVWFGTFARAKGAALLASSFDGVRRHQADSGRPQPTPLNASGLRVTESARTPERFGSARRSSLRPGLHDTETRSLAHGKPSATCSIPATVRR